MVILAVSMQGLALSVLLLSFFFAWVAIRAIARTVKRNILGVWALACLLAYDLKSSMKDKRSPF